MAGRKFPRWLFAAIPLGFVVLVGIMLLVGQPSGGPTSNPYEGEDVTESSESPDAEAEVVTDPDGVLDPHVPTPVGPGSDDQE